VISESGERAKGTEMTALCIASSPGIACDSVLSIFTGSGMDQLVNQDKDKIHSIEIWQQRIKKNNPDVTQPLKIGSFWQKVISDLYLNMLDQPCWGWHLNGDSRFLDFWGEFDSSIRFILFTTPPDYLLSCLLERDPGVYREKTLPEWIDIWTTYHQKTLSFHLRHSDRSVLLDLETFLNAPGEAIDLLKQHWSLALNKFGAMDPDQWRPSSLTRFLISQTLPKTQDIDSIVREIDDCRLILKTKSDAPLTPSDISDITEAYILLHSQAQQSRDNEDIVNQLKDERDGLAQEKEKVLKENELLLLQLHQVQEELEQYFQKNQEFETAVNKGKIVLSSLEQDKATLQKQLDSSKAESQKIEKERKNQAKLDQEQQQRLNTLNAERDGLAQEKEKVLKENELLLLQLHQVQEELEHYFLRNQEAQQEINRLKARCGRILERNPDYVDYERLAVRPTPGAHQVRWRFENINVVGRNFPAIEFRTILEGSMGGMIFDRESASPSGDGTRSTWPVRGCGTVGKY
jgi:hypothetical protein